jgi:hypothetical protein
MNHNVEPWGSQSPSLLASAYIGALKYLARGALKRPLRRTLRKRLHVVDVALDGIKLRCHMGDNFTENAIVEGRSTHDMASIARITNDLREGDVFTDVGANSGLFSMFAARKVGASGRVIAIEPIPVLVDRIRFNASANGFGQVSIWPNAVGAAEGHED